VILPHTALRTTCQPVLTRPQRLAMTMRKSFSSIDELVAQRIRERRLMLGLTQEQFGEMIGVSPQQAVKYEYGTNSVSAGRLYEIACALRTPIEYFFEGVDGSKSTEQTRGHQRMLLNVLRNFGDIKDEAHREAISELTRALAGRSRPTPSALSPG
jgi:transcriptional regulator with XRE-family HTH domain